MLKKGLFIIVILGLLSCNSKDITKIDRFALTERNNPVVENFDTLASLSVGNGNFAFTVDATGLQSFPEFYSKGVPLGTQSQWGWHSFSNPQEYKFEETLKNYNFRGKDEIYTVQFKEQGRQHDAANWYRMNPHRLHLGYIGLDLSTSEQKPVKPEDIQNVHQELKLWDGLIHSNFTIKDEAVQVKTVCHPILDMIEAEINSSLISKNQLRVNIRFPYPTGKHSDDATDWNKPELHKSVILSQTEGSAILQHTLDSTTYYAILKWQGNASLEEKETHYFLLSPHDDNFRFSCEFTEKLPAISDQKSENVFVLASNYWQNFWKNGGMVDFSQCKDPRANELERRTVLSQYLTAIQCSGVMPPQETGLTYNSWFGKFHLEMHWWHAVHFALWGRIELLERSLDWYNDAYPVAKSIAERQGFDGVRWMKMTDPSALEAPSSVGSFLIWQQPHFIYMAELVYRQNSTQEVLDKYKFLVDETAKFMASYATFDSVNNRYILKGAIPAQETLRAAETINPPFEMAYWYYALNVAQHWRERTGLERNADWDEIISKLSPLAEKDGLYLAAEDAVETYKDVRFTSDHPAVLGALGILPVSKLVNKDLMHNTLNWIWDNWNWDVTWGWDYPMTAMCAARLGEPDKAVGALLMDKRTNTYLVNGHNYQDERLRLYLPGNGGLLTTVAMMCAGWDGNDITNPGFPNDGNWDVVWEDLEPMP